MKIKNRILAGVLACITLATAISPKVFAAAPQVSTDEAVYVNLDYYGVQQNTTIVKGCSLNGNTEFTDYGSYEKVTNMSNYVKPQLSTDNVHWKIPEKTDARFYYECTLKKDAVVMPWDFDVSYKLDGVPKKAEELAGASGLVEINIKCTPNEAAKTYYRDNMLLQCMTMVDMEDTLSIEAPGSQTQSVGTYKAVIFAAVPGEETTFIVRIGTKSFETSGIVMMMLPGTLDRLKDIKDLKKAKDTVNDSADAIYHNMNDMLTILDNLSGGLQGTQDGLKKLEEARSTTSSSKGKVYDDADAALADLTATANQMTTLLPHLQNGQQLVNDLNGNINQLVNTMDGAQDHLFSFRRSITAVQNDLDDLKDLLDDDNSDAVKRKKAFNKLEKDLNSMSKDFGVIKKELTSLKALLEKIKANSTALGQFASKLGPKQQALLMSLMAAMPDLSKLIDSTSNSVDALQDICANGSELTNTLKNVLSFDDAADLADDLHDMGNTTKRALDLCIHMISNVDALNATMNKYKDGTVSLLQDTADLTQQISKSTNSTVAFMKSFEATLKKSGDKVDDGTKKTLNGLIDSLDKSLDAVDKTSDLKKQNTTIKDTFDSEIDKYTDDTRLLNLDVESKMISFTSEKNPTPQSIQMILRTQEISLDSPEEKQADLEKTPKDIGIWGRIVSVFQSIWNSIGSVFKK